MADLSITPANVVLVSGQTGDGTAGGTITAGMAIYPDSSDSNDLKAADCTASASAKIVGIALHGASDGQPLKYAKPGSVVTIGATVVDAETYVLSESGAIAPIGDLATNDYVTYVGHAATTANLDLKIMWASDNQSL